MRQRHRPRATPQHTMPCAAAPDTQLGASQIDGPIQQYGSPRVGVLQYRRRGRVDGILNRGDMFTKAVANFRSQNYLN